MPTFWRTWQEHRAEREAMLERESISFNDWVDGKQERDLTNAIKAESVTSEHLVAQSIVTGTHIHIDKDGRATKNPSGYVVGNLLGLDTFATDYQPSVMNPRPSNHAFGTAIDLHLPESEPELVFFEGEYDAARFAAGRMPKKLHEMMEVRTREILRSAPRQPSFRRGATRDAIIQNIVRNTQVLEPEWDVATMLDAHRNGATALDGQRTDLLEVVSTPVFEELSTVMFDPGCEMGPRERDWHRRQRTQPTNKSRKQRKGRRR